MKQIDCITFVDDATGCGGKVTVYQRDDAMVMVDLQLTDKPAAVVTLPGDLARRFADAVIRAIS